ncbi:MAG: extracellular solute-binding protein [Verrucomicrobia bacterium]|nr:extracellular solute-binding protein [Verrucomicrobiota bacterium]
MAQRPCIRCILPALILWAAAQVLLGGDAVLREEGVHRDVITLKVFSLALPTPGSTMTSHLATQEIIRRFEALHPHIRLTTSEGLRIEGKGDEITPLMQIAADISPDVIYVNFKNADSYTQQGFLYPLDRFVERLPKEELESRVPAPAWQVIRRPGRDGVVHTWALPYNTYVVAMVYRRDVFRAAGLSIDRGPRDWKELEDICRKIRDAQPDKYGMGFDRSSDESWHFMSFLWSAGGEAMAEVSPNQWRAVFDSPQAVEAFAFYHKLVRSDLAYRGADIGTLWKRGRIAMSFTYLNDVQLAGVDPVQYGIAPVPLGPTGIRGNEVNCAMMGIFAGVKDRRKREAAWEFIRFYDSPEARAIRTRIFVENGLASQINPRFLRASGYEEYLQDVPREWTEAFEEAMSTGKPEPFGKNSNLIYKEMSSPMDQMFYDNRMEQCWKAGDDKGLKQRVQEIFSEAVKRTNERIIGYVPPETQRFRRQVAAGVAAAVVAAFFFLFRYIWRVFTPVTLNAQSAGWGFRRHWFAYFILLPALATILIWQYIPLGRGSVMAFQDYMIMGESRWVGLDNFALLLFDPTFWNALWVTLQFTFWSLSLGFFAPVLLAILLQEVPHGKILYRTVFFLPSIVSGLIVIFLWRSFYAPDGLFNQALGWVGIQSHLNWLTDPRFALVACILPGIWAGAGPGCLIYLAALKSIPDDLYEASDLDGATFFQKIRHVIFPGLKPLLIINFVGAFAGAFHSSANILVMTGGGPYTPYGATEVTSLLIYYNAFLYLRFGFATAMAWTLGAMLVGFTVIQLKRLSRMEFKTVEEGK